MSEMSYGYFQQKAVEVKETNQLFYNHHSFCHVNNKTLLWFIDKQLHCGPIICLHLLTNTLLHVELEKIRSDNQI